MLTTYFKESNLHRWMNSNENDFKNLRLARVVIPIRAIKTMTSFVAEIENIYINYATSHVIFHTMNFIIAQLENIYFAKKNFSDLVAGHTQKLHLFMGV